MRFFRHALITVGLLMAVAAGVAYAVVRDIDPDGTWRYHAEKAGVFPYVCTLHPGMQGVLRVK
jgi:plastocyanin